ncbi:hypothetical protein [Streptomyces sp. NBC_00846]|uniref:hypothetical protein n=1 Tax=Streptomyces sp. NBC_00846 TaxID=2975849 RepID=UPI0038703198
MKFQLLAALTPLPKLLSLSACAGAAMPTIASGRAASMMIFFMSRSNERHHHRMRRFSRTHSPSGRLWAAPSGAHSTAVLEERIRAT